MRVPPPFERSILLCHLILLHADREALFPTKASFPIIPFTLGRLDAAYNDDDEDEPSAPCFVRLVGAFVRRRCGVGSDELFSDGQCL